MITKAGIIYGLRDALNARAFLLTYCKQKNYPTKNITIYTDKYWFLFEKEGFRRELDRSKMRGLVGYKNFCNYDLPKKYDIMKCDECIAKNAGIDFSFDTIVPLNWNTKIDLVLPKRFVTVNDGYGRLSGNPLDKNIPNVTDDTKLVLMLGQDVHLVEGDKLNFKITTFDDLMMLKALLKIGKSEVL